VTDGEPEPNWLDDGEMRAWRAYIIGSAMLGYRLHRELQDNHAVSLADYEILVRLSERDDHRMRMSQLAADVASSKSRVSHQVARLETLGWVRRVTCPSDARGVYAELTPEGFDQLRASAPTHLAGVRAHLIDLLTPEDHAALAAIFERVITHLREVPA
jgi:DNA-binding MarR family transcriptional regulator